LSCDSDHNLLQTLTRVNRPYKNTSNLCGRFADISKAFDRTNKMYFDELQEQLGDEMEMYSYLFKSEEIKQEIQEIKETLFHYDTKHVLSTNRATY
jgi:type I restriction enzyme R subunit